MVADIFTQSSPPLPAIKKLPTAVYFGMYYLCYMPGMHCSEWYAIKVKSELIFVKGK